MTDDTGDQPPTAAAGNDETIIVPPATEAAPELAWSSEDYTEAGPTENASAFLGAAIGAYCPHYAGT
jgi:hypothetical protein